MSEDPIGLAGGINHYAFAGNDPLNAADPTGLVSCGYVWMGQPGKWGIGYGWSSDVCSGSGASGGVGGLIMGDQFDGYTGGLITHSSYIGRWGPYAARNDNPEDVGEEAERACSAATFGAVVTTGLDLSGARLLFGALKAGARGLVLGGLRSLARGRGQLGLAASYSFGVADAKLEGRVLAGAFASQYGPSEAGQLAAQGATGLFPPGSAVEFFAGFVPGASTFTALRGAYNACFKP